MQVYKLWCEYDINQNGVVFSTVEAAIKYANKELKDYNLNYDELCDENLIGVNIIDLIEE